MTLNHITNHFEIGKSFTSLFALIMLLLVPAGAWAQEVTVAGVQQDNVGYFTGTNIQGTVQITHDETGLPTLTLNGATINGIIETTLTYLKVHFTGENVINVPVGAGAAFVGNAEVAGLSLEFSSETPLTDVLIVKQSGLDSYEGVVSGGSIQNVFYNTDYEGTWCWNWYDENEGIKFYKMKFYPLWLDSSQMTSEDLGFCQSGNIFSFNPLTNVLTMNRVGESYSSSTIRCGLDNLTIHLVGSNHIKDIVYESQNQQQTTGSLTFTAEKGEETNVSPDDKPSLQLQSDASPLSTYGDNVSYNNGLYFDRSSSIVEELTLEAPVINAQTGDDGEQSLIIECEIQLSGVKLYYSIDYADETIEDVEDSEYPTTEASSVDLPQLLGPCTVTAYAKYGDIKSDMATAKLFGLSQTELRVVKGQTVAVPTIVPAIAEGDGLTAGINTDNSIASVADGVITGNGYGSTESWCYLKFKEDASYGDLAYEILNTNDNSLGNLTITVVPPAPTIVTETATLDTDKITITMDKTLEGDNNATIYYAWDNGDFGNYPEPIFAKTGTLHAKVAYSGSWLDASGAPMSETVWSDEVTREFSIKTDISQLPVSGPTTPVTYTGQAITPDFVVYSDLKESNELATSNYTVSYQRVGQEQTPVESIVDAGSYVITITGTGVEYGGTKIVTREFKVLPVDIKQVSVAEIAPQTYTGKAIKPDVTVKLGEVTISPDQYTVAYTDSIEVGTATVTITFTSGNFTTTETALVKTVVTFQIVRRTATADQLALGNNTYVTFYTADEDLSLPEGYSAYIATGVADNEVSIQPLPYIPKNTPVIIGEGTDSEKAKDVDTQANMLHHALQEIEVSKAGGKVYGLYGGQFMRVASGTIPQGKNYLLIADEAGTAVPVGAPGLTIQIAEGSMTGVTPANRQAVGNGDVWTTLDGRHLQQKPATKGIYIKNGKKVTINHQ